MTRGVKGVATKLRKGLLNVWKARYLYLLLLPAALFFILFQYGPMSGVILAFKKYNARLGVWGSPYVGLANFQRIFTTATAMTAIKNTFVINFSRLIWQFPAAIILALLLNEMRGSKVKRIYQTVYTFPHFLSWVTVAAIIVNVFGMYGLVNGMRVTFGLDRVNYMTDSGFIRPMLFISANWKEMGWAAIIYIAAITGIDPTLYEAAVVDGATRWQKQIYIDLPLLLPTASIMLILRAGGIMNVGFEKVFLMQNPLNQTKSEVIATYVYKMGLKSNQYSMSTAVNLFNNVINFALLMLVNGITRKLGDTSLW